MPNRSAKRIASWKFREKTDDEKSSNFKKFMKRAVIDSLFFVKKIEMFLSKILIRLKVKILSVHHLEKRSGEK